MKMLAKIIRYDPRGEEIEVAKIPIPTRMKKVHFEGPHGEAPIDDELAEIPDIIRYEGQLYAPNSEVGALPAEEKISEEPEDEETIFHYLPAWIHEAGP
jgi:hypothetical protein